MQVLMPIAGRSFFFPEKEYYFPKPLVDVVGKPMIDRVINALQMQLNISKFFFSVSRDESRQYSIDKTLKILGGVDTVIIEKIGETKGALCSCLLAIDEVNHDEPLIICNSDQIIDTNLQKVISSFQNKSVAAGVVTFRSVHPRWSYAVIDEKQQVTQVAEKKVVSDNAIAGFYYFSKASLFFDAAKDAILIDDSLNDEFFISATLNQIILHGGNVATSQIDASDYHSFYSPEQIKEFADTSIANRLRTIKSSPRTINVIIPAAGEGSRFAEKGWKKPKPFIDVNGQTMLESVIDNVAPEGFSTTLLLRSEHINKNSKQIKMLKQNGSTILSVEALTEGTACTVLLARNVFDDDNPLLISNSDQLVDFDCRDFVEDCFSRNLDGSILVFHDIAKDPKWSFAKLDKNSLVTEVAEKNPISNMATVGIYLFRRGSDYVSAAVDMIVRNDRVNDEFYTCPVYNYMIKNGLKIGVYEIDAKAMRGLGTPEDLRTYLNEIGAPVSADQP